MKVSIIVCSYDRPELLGECLVSLLQQTCLSSDFEVIVVDNGSSEATRAVFENVTTSGPPMKFLVEPQIGLSVARNRGLEEASAEWVGFIDDDAKAMPDWVSRALEIIDREEFDAFGGRYVPWYRESPPKWFRDEWGSNQYCGSEYGILPPSVDFSGGNAFYRKSALLTVGGFPSTIGMKGKRTGYGEENHVQAKMREASYKLGFDPSLVVEHLVADYKLKVSWRLKAHFAHGRDLFLSARGNKFTRVLSAIALEPFLTCVRLLTLFPRLLLNKDYYWQNFILDVFGKAASRAGTMVGLGRLAVRYLSRLSTES